MGPFKNYIETEKRNNVNEDDRSNVEHFDLTVWKSPVNSPSDLLTGYASVLDIGFEWLRNLGPEAETFEGCSSLEGFVDGLGEWRCRKYTYDKV